MEHFKVSSRKSTAVNSRLRAERNALMSELGRLKNTGVRVDDDVLEQCANHDISYDLGANVYEESNRERLNADVDDPGPRPRFDSTWRAREIDADSTEGLQVKPSHKASKSSSRRSRSHNPSSRGRSYRHHDSHENMSTTESSSSSSAGSASDDELFVTARKYPEHHRRSKRSRSRSRWRMERSSRSRTRSRSPKPKGDMGDSVPLTMKDLSPSSRVKSIFDALPRPETLAPSELDQIKKALTGEIEEKRVRNISLSFATSLRSSLC